MPECTLIPKSCFLTFCSTIEFNPYLPFEFLIFIILVCLLFIHAISIYNNFSACAQNVTGAYIIIMLVYRHLLTMRLHGKKLCDSK